MLRSNIQLGDFITQLKLMLRSIVVKRDKLATAFDTTLEFKKAADKYISTIDNGHMWESYVQFDRDVLLAAGLDENMVYYYMANKENIPREYRDRVVELQRQYIIDHYEEMNDYYLMLNGKPPIEDTEKDWIYCPANDYHIPTNIPVHKLDHEYINMMDSVGILGTLIKNNPSKTYLKYLGKRSIDYYTARTADNFAILYLDTKGIDSVIREDFIQAYDKARAYYMVGYYNREYSNMFTWYDEFMGLLIVIMAVQRLIANIYKQGLTRDFYDVNLIKYLFKSYSIPYLEEMDIKYQRALAKNLNNLLRYKSTDRVLYDVSYLLGFYDINIYKYYLMKTHLFDPETGNPIFAYKTHKENGEIVTEYDYEKMFRFHFQQVNLEEDDVNSALVDRRYRYDYEDIVGQDPYWVDDNEMIQKLYESDFNHIVTKYMSLDITVKMVEMIYEVSHTLRAVIDNQEDFKKIMINIPVISEYDMSLYDAIILLCALGAKKFGLEGKIPLKGYQIANVYGFNYTADIDGLKQAIYDTKDLETGQILFAEDMQAFYVVGPGPKIEIPNHFRNELVSETTSETVTVQKNTFKAIPVKLIRDATEIDELLIHYKWIPPDTPVYRFINDGYNVVTAASLESLDGIKIVREIPETAPAGSMYMVYPEGDLIYHVPSGDIEEEVIFVSTFGYNLIDNGLAQYILHMRAVTENDLGTIYANLKTLRVFITKMLAETHDKDVYSQYKKLYNALLVTEDVQELYKDTDGNIHETYKDLLKACNSSLYTEYQRMIGVDNGINSGLNALFSKLASFGEYKFLANINRSSSMFDVVMQLIRFFKSYTVDFVNSGIRYVFNDRYFQGLKLMDDMMISTMSMQLGHPLSHNETWYKDLMNGMTSIHSILDKYYKYLDWIQITAILWLWDKHRIIIRDSLFRDTHMMCSDRMDWYDEIIPRTQNMFAMVNLKMLDSLLIKANLLDMHYDDDDTLHDDLKVTKYIDAIEDIPINRVPLYDVMESMHVSNIDLDDKIKKPMLNDALKIYVNPFG